MELGLKVILSVVKECCSSPFHYYSLCASMKNWIKVLPHDIIYFLIY